MFVVHVIDYGVICVMRSLGVGSTPVVTDYGVTCI